MLQIICIDNFKTFSIIHLLIIVGDIVYWKVIFLLKLSYNITMVFLSYINIALH